MCGVLRWQQPTIPFGHRSVGPTKAIASRGTTGDGGRYSKSRIHQADDVEFPSLARSIHIEPPDAATVVTDVPHRADSERRYVPENSATPTTAPRLDRHLILSSRAGSRAPFRDIPSVTRCLADGLSAIPRAGRLGSSAQSRVRGSRRSRGRARLQSPASVA